MDLPFPILFIGDANRAEFQQAAAWLSSRGATLADDFPSAMRLLIETDFSPAVIVLAEFAPPRLPNDQLLALRHAAPLARIIRLLGPWFEGEVRTGQPLPATLRTYWHQWAARWQLPLESWPMESGSAESLQSEGAPWSLPITAVEDEQLLAIAHHEEPASSYSAATAPLIAIIAQHRDTAQALGDLCAFRGWKTMWLHTPPVETPLIVAAILFDSRAAAPSDLETIKHLKTISNGAPIIVLQGFPRQHDLARWQSAGASALLAKPFMAADLFAQIEQFLPKPISAAV